MLACVESFAQMSRDSVQALFPSGKFVSFNNNIACYRLRGVKDGGMYGYCVYDTTYEPEISTQMKSWDIQKGEETTKYLNSPCYTIIAPIFDYALPFRQGWAPVCINKKWSYVSVEGNYLFDFVLDAAYPFKEGKAKVIFDGKSYEVDLKGIGLPDFAYNETGDIQVELKAKTINQLYSESQYEKTIEKGKQCYSEITNSKNGKLPELSGTNLKSAIQIAFATMSAQNSLMASTGSRLKELFNIYRTIPITHCLSFESRHPAINKCNAEPYLESFKKKYAEECCDIIQEIERYDYKSAILKFEEWTKGKTIEDDINLLMTYYYLSELSDDFEQANKLLINISNKYEKEKGQLGLDEYSLCVLLSDIKKYQSAESLFNKLNKQAKNKEKLFLLYYNMALMYKSVNEERKSIEYFNKALLLRESVKYIPALLECMSDLIHTQLSVGEIDKSVLTEYALSEIEYNATMFETENTLIANRLWGNSIQRVERVLEYLGKSSDNNYLRMAFALSVFQQGVPFDTEKYLTKIVNSSNNANLKKKYKIFLEKKSEYKGIDVFNLISAEDEVKENIYRLFEEEYSLKQEIIQQGKHYIPTEHYQTIATTRLKGKNMIDIVDYRDNCDLFRIGAFAHSSGGDISYIPLSIYDEFSSDDFWAKIDIVHKFTQNEDVYMYHGVLDTLGLEYRYKGNGTVPYLQHRLHRVSSLANIFDDVTPQSNDDIVLYGGLDYGDNSIAENRGASKGYLQYSEEEVNSISEIFENVGKEVQIKTDIDGTAESVSSMSGKSPLIFHLATHGYSYPKEHTWNPLEDRFNYYRQNTDIQQREWLMNNTGLYVSQDSTGNNVLYANAVASCDLSQTELVVLSACSTISGNRSDGNAQTVGLTTAFSLASAHNIITSLRDVNDEKACEFMVTFYEKYARSWELYESFRETVLSMRQKYPNNPEYWNSFVLVEN